MNRLTTLLLCLTPFLLTAQGINSQKEKKAREISLKASQLLQEKKFDQLIELCNESIKSKMTDSKWEQLFSSLENSYGSLDSILDFAAKTKAEANTYHRGLQFQKQKFDLSIRLDSLDQISSIRITPYSDKTKWEAPDYVDFNTFSTESIKVGEVMPLIAEYTQPKEEHKKIIVILVHGSGPSNLNERIGPNEPFKDLAYGLASKGIGSIRYNKRTYDYPAYMSKNTSSMGINEIVVNDAILAIKKAKAMGAEKVVLVGHSLGGHVAPMIAEREPVDGVISLAGNATVLEDILLPQFEHLMKYDSSSGITDYQINTISYQIKNLKKGDFDSTTVGPVLPLGLPGKFWLSLKDYNPPKVAKKQDIPYLILNGGRDYQVPPAETKKWKNGSKHQLSKTIIYPQLNHLFFAGEGVCIPSEYEKIGHINSVVLNDMIEWVSKL